MPIQKLLFIDTNIWLDFYRARNEITLELLRDVETIAGSVVVTYQLESEFKKNRQAAILEGMQELKAPANVARLGIFANSRETKMISRSAKEVEKRIKTLKTRLGKVLADPASNDPVYQACQRIFHKDDGLVLTREDKKRHLVRRKAWRRFLHGCPPRKKNDTSIGDALNWEWMIHCANENNAELVIVTRDSDYGIYFDGQSYVNDHLKQEFSERVSQRRKLLLYSKITDALKHFKVTVSKAASEAEAELVTADSKPATSLHFQKDLQMWREILLGSSTLQMGSDPPKDA